MRFLCLLFLLCLSCLAFADEAKQLNIYVWSNYIPDAVVQQFEKETGIKVNINEYDSNETLYAKLEVNPRVGYDIVVPSSFYVDRMRRQDMLHTIDKSRLSNLHYLMPSLLNRDFDRHNQYSIPYLWGTTAIVLDKRYWDPKSVKRWSDLWQPRFRNQLLMYDNTREVFAVAMITLGYSINDSNPDHIRAAYEKIKELMPNIRLFNDDAVISIYADGDASIGMGQNGDVALAMQDNPNLVYIYPEDGFSIWIDSLVIPKYAPHVDNALRFIDFILRPEISKQIILSIGFSTPNRETLKLLPLAIRNNPIYNPPASVLKRGHLQKDLQDAVPIYQHYWQLLKLGATK